MSTSITIGASTFASTLFGSPMVPPWEFTRVSQTFFGVVGEQNLYGKFNSRYITIPYTLIGYSTHYLLQVQIAVLAAAVGTSGSLVYDINDGSPTTFTQCIFEGFMPDESPWLDASGVNGWQVTGSIKFRQVAS